MKEGVKWSTETPLHTCGGPQRDSFQKNVLIRFAHCDPAGIVFYPQYFVIMNGLMEDWFTFGLKVGFANLVTNRRIGIPTVRMDCTFLRPSNIGDVLTLSVSVARIGTKSFSVVVSGTADGQLRLRAEQTLVILDLGTMRSISIPDDIREGLARYAEVKNGCA